MLQDGSLHSPDKSRRYRVYLQSRIANRKSQGQGGGIGRRARLRIGKSSISERRFSFQNKVTSRQENAEFSQILDSTNNEQKTRHSSTNSSTRTHQTYAHVRLIIGGGCRTS